MAEKRPDLLLINLILAVALGGLFQYKQTLSPPPATEFVQSQRPPILRKLESPTVFPPQISLATPNYLDYAGVISQLKKWEEEAKDWIQVGTYGKSAKGQDLTFLKINNKLSQNNPVVLITASIHGNEPWSTGCVMAYIGNLLDGYSKNPEIKELLDTRTIYFVPVLSPDSYPRSREVDGVDPNRDFPGPSRPNHQSTPSIKAIQDFFLKIKPQAVISGHTHGRIFLTPYGDKNNPCPNQSDYQRIIGQMGQFCQYKVDRACNMYGRPIHGSEVDWYYRNQSFSVVMEFGTHQQKPSPQEIKSEFDRTFKGVLYFLKEAPLVKISLP